MEAADAIHQYGAIASIELSHGWMECRPEFLAVGDCVKPGRVLQAVRTGYDAAMAI